MPGPAPIPLPVALVKGIDLLADACSCTPDVLYQINPLEIHEDADGADCLYCNIANDYINPQEGKHLSASQIKNHYTRNNDKNFSKWSSYGRILLDQVRAFQAQHNDIDSSPAPIHTPHHTCFPSCNTVLSVLMCTVIVIMCGAATGTSYLPPMLPKPPHEASARPAPYPATWEMRQVLVRGSCHDLYHLPEVLNDGFLIRMDFRHAICDHLKVSIDVAIQLTRPFEPLFNNSFYKTTEKQWKVFCDGQGAVEVQEMLAGIRRNMTWPHYLGAQVLSYTKSLT